MTTDLETKIRKIIAWHAAVTLDSVQPETNLHDDIGFDSLDDIEAAMAIEDEFDIEMPDAELENIETVQQAIDLVRKHVDAKRSAA